MTVDFQHPDAPLPIFKFRAKQIKIPEGVAPEIVSVVQDNGRLSQAAYSTCRVVIEVEEHDELTKVAKRYNACGMHYTSPLINMMGTDMDRYGISDFAQLLAD